MTVVVVAVALGAAFAISGAGRRPLDRLRLGGVPRTPQGGAARHGGSGHVVAGVVGVAVLVVVGIPPPVVAGAALAAVGLVRQGSRARRRRSLASAQAATVETVFALAAELRAGQPPARAMALVAGSGGPLGDHLAEAATAVHAGAPAAEEIDRLARWPGCEGFRGVAAAWEVTLSAGGPVADVLDRLAETLDADRQTRDALSAALAGPRTTMVILAGLPVVGLLLGQSLGAHPLDFLVHRPVGWLLAGAAATLDLAGLGWMALLTRRALR